MRNILILIIAFFFINLCKAQKQFEIDSLVKSGNYFLGTYNIDSTNFEILWLETNIDISKIVSFYILLTSPDSTLYYESGGGQNNFLWTKRVIQKFDSVGFYYNLLEINWEYREERFKAAKRFLGTIYIKVKDKATNKNICDFAMQVWQKN